MPTPLLRYEPEKLDNYSPWLRPVPPLELETICDKPTICLEVSCAFIPYLVGLLELARWPDRFSGTPEQQQKSAGLFRDLMGEIAMSCGCDGSEVTIVIDHRITIYGEWQISIDGGETWTPDPAGIEPQIPSLPPPVNEVTGVDKCKAASWGVEHAQKWKDEYIAQLEETNTEKEKAVAVLLALVDMLLVVAGLPWLTGAASILLGLMEVYLEMSPEAFAALFTSDVWDDFLCILFCNMRDDGTFDTAGFKAAGDDCESKISGGFGSTSAALWLQIMLKQIGREGLNQICAYGTIETMDCDDCECNDPCDLDFWTIDPSDDNSNGVIDGRNPMTGDITVSSTEPKSDGKYYVVFSTSRLHGANSGCYCNTNLTCNFEDRGTPYAPAIPSGGLMQNHCVNHVGLVHDEPFTDTINFGDCPD